MPVTSSHQAFLLNKIVIGQFFMTKYKVGISKISGTKNPIVRNINISLWSIATKNNINAGDRIVKNRMIPNSLGYEAFKDLPSLFKKPFSLSKLTFAPCAAIYGTTNNITKRNIQAPVSIIGLPTNNVTGQPKLIPNQSIRFQKLSLFKRALMKFFITRQVVVYRCILTTFTDLILARFKKTIKVITAVLLIITTIGWTGSTCSANELLPLITQAEDRYLIPRGLLLAISTIESGNRPYALNIAGKAVIATSKQEAVAVARHHLDQGRSNIDLGVMQLNFYWHGKHFENIEEMLTPSSNINYGAKFLSDLYRQHGSWQKAVRYYHSSSPEHYKQYSRKVLISWLGV